LTRRVHVWTEEDAAFATAQWASGISRWEIASYFGYANGSVVGTRIAAFIWNHVDYPIYPWDGLVQGDERKALVKCALAVFVERRNARLEAAGSPVRCRVFGDQPIPPEAR
jgi:hypothetical protein